MEKQLVKIVTPFASRTQADEFVAILRICHRAAINIVYIREAFNLNIMWQTDWQLWMAKCQRERQLKGIPER